ncbi:hypothetical protein LZ30DRAFT_739133 [Colletotrichum cereale]|nr:hypothetical protein LZ30DRAFT_739133 [Colletotrichum cereale]
MSNTRGPVELRSRIVRTEHCCMIACASTPPVRVSSFLKSPAHGAFPRYHPLAPYRYRPRNPLASQRPSSSYSGGGEPLRSWGTLDPWAVPSSVKTKHAC